MEKILIIEDENKIAEMVKDYLEKEGFQIDIAKDGLEGLTKIEKDPPSLVILDLMLPQLNGIEICKRIRASNSQKKIGIIMLTAKSSEVDKLLGLELGADDYITKPFSLLELTARVKAVLRRIAPQELNSLQTKEVINAGDLSIDLIGHQVFLEEVELNLTPTEFKILTTLIKQPGRVFSRLQLLEIALGDAYSGYERSIDTHVSNLRKKIEVDINKPAYILTVFGLGYKFNPQITIWK